MATKKHSRTSTSPEQAAKDGLMAAQLDLSALQQLFECVNDQVQSLIDDGGEQAENLALTLECIAEKGIRHANEAMARLHKFEVKARELYVHAGAR